jgi:Rrf2 family nitric oxide-sensitive transcriptional repressor
MHIPQTAEYALRAILWLAREPSAVRKTAEIARATRVPTGYLSKVLQALARGQLLTSIAGRNGGFCLARPAAQISVLDVIQAVAPLGRFHTCPLGIEDHNGSLCLLHRRLDEAMASVERAFAATRITELLEGEGECHRPLCEPPGVQEQSEVAASVEGGRAQWPCRTGRRPKGGTCPASDCPGNER